MTPLRRAPCPSGRRTLWARRAPPCANGGLSPTPEPPGGSPRGIGRHELSRAGAAGAAELPVVDVEKLGAFATGHVERAVRPEGERADGVAGKLLRERVEQDALGRLHGPRRRGVQPRDPPAHGAAGVVRPWRRRAIVHPRWHGRARAGRVLVERIQDVDVRPRRERRIELHAEEAAVPVVVHLRTEVREDRSAWWP